MFRSVFQVVSRWWCQFTSLYWVDTLAMDLAAFLPGQGEAKMVRPKTTIFNVNSKILGNPQHEGTAAAGSTGQLVQRDGAPQVLDYFLHHHLHHHLDQYLYHLLNHLCAD